MATRFYLPSSGTAGASPATDAGWGSTVGTSRVPAPTTKTNTAFDSSGTYSETSASAINVMGRQFVSDPIAAQTITGTFSLVVACLESATTADASLQAILRVVSGDGSTVRGTLYAGHSAANNATAGALGQEMATGGQTRIMNAVALSSVTAQAGDRLVIEVGARFANTVTSSRSVTFQWGDPTASADYALTAGNTSLTNDAWLEFSQTITFQGSGTTGALAGTSPVPSGALTGTETMIGALAGSAQVPVGALAGTTSSPGLSTHVDTFDDGTVDSTLWPSQSGSVIETGGRLRIPAEVGNVQWIESRRIYSFDSVYAQVFPPAVGGATDYVYCQIYIRPDNIDVDVIMSVDPLANQLRFMIRTVGNPDANWFGITYDPVAHAWWRMRLSGGNVLWDTSPDGSTWTNRRTEVAPSWVDSPSLYLQMEAGRGTGTTDYAEYDNFNSPAPSADTGALAGTAPMPTGGLTGTETATGALAGAAPMPTGGLTGTETATGALAGTAPMPTGALAGTETATGALAGTAPMPTGGLTGTETATGALAGTAPMPTGGLTGTETATGALAGAAPMPTGGLTGTETATGALAGTTSLPTGAFDADVIASGGLVGSVPVPAGALTGSTLVEGGVAGTTPLPTGALDGDVIASGALTGTVPAPAGALGGGETATGALAGTSPVPHGALTSSTVITATLAGAAPTPIGALDADVVDSAALAGIAPVPAGGLAGDVVASAALAAAAPLPAGALEGDVTDTGALACAIPAPSGTLDGDETATGALAGTTPLPVGALTSATVTTGAVDTTLPVPTADLAGDTIDAGLLAGTIPLPGGAFGGDGATLLGTLVGVAPVPSGALSGSAQGTGALSGTTPPPAGGMAGVVIMTGALAGAGLLPTAALNRAPVVHYPLLPGAVVDNVTRYRGGDVIDNRTLYLAGEAS